MGTYGRGARGLRSTADAQRLHAMAAAGLEAHLHLIVLNMNGLNGLMDVAPGPEESFVPPPVRAHRQKKVTVKRGVGQHGERVDERTVAISSSAEDPYAEVDAEIAALV